jgi:ferrous iron transport protein B
MGAIKREMNNIKWFWFAIGYECIFAYLIALVVNQLGNLFTGNVNVIGLIAAILIIAGMIYMLVRPYQESHKLRVKA